MVACDNCCNRGTQDATAVGETLPNLSGWKGLITKEMIPDKNSNGLVEIVLVNSRWENRIFEQRVSCSELQS